MWCSWPEKRLNRYESHRLKYTLALIVNKKPTTNTAATRNYRLYTHTGPIKRSKSTYLSYILQSISNQKIPTTMILIIVVIAALMFIVLLPAIVDPQERRAWYERLFKCRRWSFDEEEEETQRYVELGLACETSHSRKHALIIMRTSLLLSLSLFSLSVSPSCVTRSRGRNSWFFH